MPVVAAQTTQARRLHRADDVFDSSVRDAPEGLRIIAKRLLVRFHTDDAGLEAARARGAGAIAIGTTRNDIGTGTLARRCSARRGRRRIGARTRNRDAVRASRSRGQLHGVCSLRGHAERIANGTEEASSTACQGTHAADEALGCVRVNVVDGVFDDVNFVVEKTDARVEKIDKTAMAATTTRIARRIAS